MPEFIHTGRVATLIEDMKVHAEERLETGFLITVEDQFEYCVEKELEWLYKYTSDDLQEDAEDLGETLEDRGEDNTYYYVNDVVDAIRRAWDHAEIDVDNLVYIKDGVDIALEYRNETWDAMIEYGHSTETCESIDDLLFTAASCYVDQRARELFGEATEALIDAVETFEL